MVEQPSWSHQKFINHFYLKDWLAPPPNPTVHHEIISIFLSLSRLHPWKISMEKSSLFTVIYVEFQSFYPSGKISGSVCRIWRGFFWGEMWQKNRWRMGNHLHKKIICQLQRQSSTMREISRPPFHVSLVSQYLTGNLMFYLLRRGQERSNNTGL